MTETALHLEIPAWLAASCAAAPAMPDPAGRMRFVIDLARRNVDAGTGGPFAAAVFERDTGRLVAAGVNLVVPGRCSSAHAEVVALSLAQRRLDTHDLGGAGLPAHELTVSAEPCAMCLGALLWSGVRRLVCAARAADIEAIGFDEGPKHPDWTAECEKRGVAVVRDILRLEAVAVLQEYAARGGPIYNARRGA